MIVTPLLFSVQPVAAAFEPDPEDPEGGAAQPLLVRAAARYDVQGVAETPVFSALDTQAEQQIFLPLVISVGAPRRAAPVPEPTTAPTVVPPSDPDPTAAPTSTPPSAPDPTATSSPPPTPAPGTGGSPAPGSLVIDGTPSFPFGFYHISWMGERRMGDLLAQDIELLAAAGFDLIHATIDPDAASARALDVADKLGMHVIGEYYEPSAETTFEMFREHPAMLGWDVADDFSEPPTGPEQNPSDVSDKCDWLHRLDGSAVAYGSSPGHPEYPNTGYVDIMDVVGIQVYPVSNLNGPFESVLEENIGTYTHSRALFGAETPMLAALQSFAWSSGRYPTAEETRNMFYGALIAGYNGVLAYAFYDETGLLSEKEPAQWREFTLLRQDLDALAPALVYGERTVYDSLGDVDDLYPLTPGQYPSGIGRPRIHAGLWQYGDEIVIVVLNTDPDDALQAAIPLPSDAGTRLTPLFESGRYGDSLSLRDGRLVGEVAPAGVQVYRITR